MSRLRKPPSDAVHEVFGTTRERLRLMARADPTLGPHSIVCWRPKESRPNSTDGSFQKGIGPDGQNEKHRKKDDECVRGEELLVGQLLVVP